MTPALPVAPDAGPGPGMDEPLKRILGARTATSLAKLGLETTGDLLRHYPRRYAEPGTMTDLASLVVGEHVTVMARVASATVRSMRSRGGAMMQAVVTDDVHRLNLTFFSKGPGALRVHEDRLRPGAVGLFTGTVGEYRGERQLTHPDYVLVGADADDEAAALTEASRPVPIYPASAAVPTWRIQRAVRTVLDPLTEEQVPDPVPAEILGRHRYPSLLRALRLVHLPFTTSEAHRGLARLRYEEALVLQTELARRRAEVAALHTTARPARPGGLLEAFDARLPFTLTAGQQEVGEQLAGDLAQSRPMQRLLQGDVGSGKTIVALRAMLQVVDAGGQAAILAPTEVLAAQHHRTIRALLGPLAEAGTLMGEAGATRVALLTGSLGARARKEALLEAASGQAGIVVGTHALLGEHVQFADLGLIVVDEQHRFGVEQRDALRGRAQTTPHMLVMTATPIPRTVAMTLFGDLEISELAGLPDGRAGVATHVVPAGRPAWVGRIWQRVREEVDAGNRVYVVCPRIDSDDAAGDDLLDDGGLLLDDDATGGPDDAAGAPAGSGPARPPLSAVTEVAEQLRAMPALDGVRIGTLHGRLGPTEKEQAMADLASGAAPVLVATTVVEVGVDVPEATLMVILDADRFGISQLHQLRGRVGRGSRPGTCLLVSHAEPGTDAFERVERLASTTDGFELARLDLELRREGDVLGAAQSGKASSLRLLRVVRDADLIARARQDAEALVAEDPALAAWPGLAAAIEDRLRDDSKEFIDRS